MLPCAHLIPSYHSVPRVSNPQASVSQNCTSATSSDPERVGYTGQYPAEREEQLGVPARPPYTPLVLDKMWRCFEDIQEEIRWVSSYPQKEMARREQHTMTMAGKDELRAGDEGG